jgi:sarcosine oxidase subunit gamma
MIRENHRSPIYRVSEASQTSASVTCTLQDFSLNKRCGFRGPNAAVHLASLDLPVPEQPNLACTTEQDLTILRLSKNEFWVLADTTAAEEHLNTVLDTPTPNECYPLFCQDSHAWLELSGQHLADIMAKVCAVDMRESEFTLGSIAQTSVARINAIVVHRQSANGPVFTLLSDSSSASYFWDAIEDAMLEFNQ